MECPSLIELRHRYLYRTLILPKLENVCEIHLSATDARLRVLDSVHHVGVRLVTGAFRTSPIPSLLVDAGFWPLDLRRQSSMLRCWFRTHRLPHFVPCLSILRDSRSQAYVIRPSLPKPFGLRVANLMVELSIDPTPVYSFRLLRVGDPQPYCDDCLVPLTVRHLLIALV
ncbi:hypothetical protein E2C01_055621 [Portunus trituberculatus]|uniref:Uncharacterized protein n=1 Tax=Portunus trituberculatus TaxID=210409 RepID=A0A5B7GXD3_PORTR|nr:hypothetical protein [Portunus trituberculatus]